MSNNSILILISSVVFVIFCIALLGLIISIIYQFIKKRWFKAILTLLTFILTLGIGVLYILGYMFCFMISYSIDDHFTDDLTIPENIEYNLPKEMESRNYNNPDTIIKRDTTDFELQNAGRGNFRYNLWIGKIERGTVYLKAFEVTKNQPLSTKGVSKESSIIVYNATDAILKFGTSSSFVIYEGGIGKPYLARFEVWFKPDNEGKERKLMEKIYMIEGWQF
jgi:hypothetical protein